MEEKKIEILERAAAVYMKFGIKSVTMDDLSRELGISKKTVYKYFRDKNELVLNMIEMKVDMDKALCLNCQQNAENAIDDLINVSKLIIEHLSNVNPVVFYDLKKYHPEAWQVMKKHKWDFVLSMIKENITRGIKEEIYRDNLNTEIISKLYVASTDTVMNGDIFPWPDFKFQDVFIEMIRLHIMGMTNDVGRKYLKKKLKKEDYA